LVAKVTSLGAFVLDFSPSLAAATMFVGTSFVVAIPRIVDVFVGNVVPASDFTDACMISGAVAADLMGSTAFSTR
jgi:hypothetical protein